MSHTLDFFSILQIALSVTAPIFLIIILGIYLNHIKLINQEFIHTSSKLIFNVGLPVLLFISTATQNFDRLINVTHIALLLATTFIMFLISTFTAGKFTSVKEDRGVFVQGAFRGNLIIVGLALSAIAYPEQGIAIATLPMAIIIIVYNLLSIYTLNASLHNQRFSLKKNMHDIVRNPLIIGITTGLIVNFFKIPTPAVLIQTGNYLGQMILPLALLAIGGSLNFSQLQQNMYPATIASLWKVIISPAILIILVLIFPIEGDATGVLFFLVASPTASASFIMVKAMKGNSDLAAKIIIASTSMSLFTITLGFAVLVSTGVVTI
ncbi:MAG: AEC family transporter [Colwellia sp.]